MISIPCARFNDWETSGIRTNGGLRFPLRQVDSKTTETPDGIGDETEDSRWWSKKLSGNSRRRGGGADVGTCLEHRLAFLWDEVRGAASSAGRSRRRAPWPRYRRVRERRRWFGLVWWALPCSLGLGFFVRLWGWQAKLGGMRPQRRRWGRSKISPFCRDDRNGLPANLDRTRH